MLTRSTLALLIGLNASASGQIGLQVNEIKECPGGTESIVTLPWSNSTFRKSYALEVFGPLKPTTSRTLSQFKSDLLADKKKPVLIFNGGYFKRSNHIPLSYYQSAISKLHHNRNSAVSPRGCMVYQPNTLAHQVVQSTENKYLQFKTMTDAEIFCGGPQLVKTGKDVKGKLISRDVSQTQYCTERFDPSCRTDGSDAGLKFNESVARTGVCALPNGDLKIFIYASNSDSCGVAVPTMAQRMLKEGCTTGLNLDGGGSTKLYVKTPTREMTVMGSEDGFFSRSVSNRSLPVWISVYEKTKTGK